MIPGIIAVHPFISPPDDVPPPGGGENELTGTVHFFGSDSEYSIGGLDEGPIHNTLQIYDASAGVFTDIYQRYRVANDFGELSGFVPRAIDGNYCISMEVNEWGGANRVFITPYYKNADLKVGESEWADSTTLVAGTDVTVIDCYPFDFDSKWKPRDIVMLAKGKFLVLPLNTMDGYEFPLSIVTYTGPASVTHDNPVYQLEDLGYSGMSIRASGMTTYDQISVAVRLNDPVVAFRIPVSYDGDMYLMMLYDTDAQEIVSHTLTDDALVSPLSLFTSGVDELTLHHDYTNAYYSKTRASAGGIRTGDESIDSNYGANIGYQTYTARTLDVDGHLSYEDLTVVMDSPQVKLAARLSDLGYTPNSEYEPKFGLSGMFIS